MAEHHVGLSRRPVAIRTTITGKRCTDDDVVEPVTIDVARRGHAEARFGATRDVAEHAAFGIAHDYETLRTEIGKIDVGEPAAVAEDYVGLAGTGAAVVPT